MPAYITIVCIYRVLSKDTNLINVSTHQISFSGVLNLSSHVTDNIYSHCRLLIGLDIKVTKQYNHYQ